MSSKQAIILDGVRVHNLQSVHVEIPLGKLTVVTGVSGAGKGSLVFDTLYAEAQRRYLQSFSAATRQLLERIDKPDADAIGDLPPAVALRRRPPARGPRATVASVTEVGDMLRTLLARAGEVHCWQCGTRVERRDTADVLAAVAQLPVGTRATIAFPAAREALGDPQAWAAGLLEDGLVRVQIGTGIYRLGEQPLPALAESDRAWVLLDRLETGKTAPERVRESADAAFTRGQGRAAILLGAQELIFDRRLICPRCELLLPEPEPRLFASDDPRWASAALAVRIAGRNHAELSAMSLDELAAFLRPLALEAPGTTVLLDQLRQRVAMLRAIDLGHITLERPASTLSGGITVRLRIATARASNLAEALYVIEEPTAGLHPRDTGKLLTELRQLVDAGNTLVVVEHHRDILNAADHVIDVGPGAGADGGRILYQGPPTGLSAETGSPTADFWSGRTAIATPAKHRKPRGAIKLSNVRTRNLQNLTVEFPLGVLCVVTGVSGAGKSSLVVDTLYPALCHAKHKKGAEPVAARISGAGYVEDVILMDQQPLKGTGRSNPATYLKILDEIREVFAATAEAKIHNFGPGFFSFNQPGGRCETCEGQGTQTVDMQFLADVTVTCPECHGQRFRREILEVKVRGLSIAEVLDMPAREAFRFFRAQPAVERRLKHLLDVGLDYIRLGQLADALAPGEAQRLKLAGHLASSRKPHCLFIMVEPSAGMHPADVDVLLGCLERLLDAGHSLVLIENNLDVIRCADHVIDLGPEAGGGGGRIVAVGTPEEIAQVETSHTGRCLGYNTAGR